MKRRTFVLGVLADGNPSYDVLCRAVIEAFPERNKYQQSVKAVRAVRNVLWDELAVIDSDETLWLTAAGWAKVPRLDSA
jgi:hypothetical protein